MATQDFGLSFTVSAPALWVDNEQGVIGEASTIFAQTLSFNKIGEAGTIFADIIALEKIGEAGTAGSGTRCTYHQDVVTRGMR